MEQPAIKPLPIPYTTSGPVIEDGGFVGRMEILEAADRFVKGGKQPHLLLFGMPGMGKTSLLLRLHRLFAITEKRIPVYFDPSAHQEDSEDHFFPVLIQNISEALGLSGPEITNSPPDVFFGKVLPDHLSRNHRKTVLVLLIDEFKSTIPSENIRQYYVRLRDLTSGAAGNIKTILAFGKTPEDIEAIRDPVFPEAELVSLPLFSDNEVAELVRLSEKNSTLRWPDIQVWSVRNFTAGHPALIQGLCRAVWDQLAPGGNGTMPSVSFRDMGQGVSQAIRLSDPFLNSLWRQMDSPERILVAALAEGGNQPMRLERLEARIRKYMAASRNGGIVSSIRRLENWGLVFSENGGYRIGSIIMSRWFVSRKPFDRLGDEMNREAEALFHQSRKDVERERLESAERRLRRAVQIKPDHLNCGCLLAKVLIRRGFIHEAVRQLERLDAYGNPSVRALYIRSLHLLMNREKDEAARIEICQHLLKIEPKNPQTRTRLREMLESRGDRAYESNAFDEAKAAYASAGAGKKVRMVEETIRQIEAAGRIDRKRRRGSLKRKLVIVLGFPLLFLAVAGFLVYTGYQHVTRDLPKIGSLKDYHPPLVSMVYAANGDKIAEFYRERRIVRKLEDIPELLIRAFVSAEDARFFTHEGVDLIGITRAFFKNIEAGAIVQGGSTITQQVIKSFLLGKERSYERKIKEAVLAYRIDKTFSKQEILFLYLNQIYLGYGAYGVEAAAENYFGKTLESLTIGECAMLAGLAKAPSRDAPVTNFDRARKRQRYVLDRMTAEGYITPEQADAAYEEKTVTRPRPDWYADGYPFFTEHVRLYLEELLGEDLLFNGGLTIHTTLDPEMQKIAREQVEEGLKKLESRHRYRGGRKPEGALICTELETGHVKAMVGGRDFSRSQFNRATQARRQPGSAFKPVIYAAALDKGFTTATILQDSPAVYPDRRKVWRPSNYDRKFYGPLPLRKALAKSRNLPVVKVLDNIGTDYAIEFARKLGITAHLDPGLSLALGASGVSLYEMVQAYSVFPNRGMLNPAVFITRITDRFGNEIYQNPGPEQVIEPSTAFIMTSLLRSVVQEGTGYKVKKLRRPAAGKTGTTNDFRDAWYVGFTPGYITGTWVGFDVERPLGRSETGSRAAIPIWMGFMKEMLADKPVREFPETEEGVVFAKIDAESGLLPVPESRNVVTECFKEGTVPHEFTPPPVYVITRPEEFFKADL